MCKVSISISGVEVNNELQIQITLDNVIYIYNYYFTVAVSTIPLMCMDFWDKVHFWLTEFGMDTLFQDEWALSHPFIIIPISHSWPLLTRTLLMCTKTSLGQHKYIDHVVFLNTLLTTSHVEPEFCSRNIIYTVVDSYHPNALFV